MLIMQTNTIKNLVTKYLLKNDQIEYNTLKCKIYVIEINIHICDC